MGFKIGRFLLDLVGLLVGSFVASGVFLLLPALWGALGEHNSVRVSLLPGAIIICFFSFPCGLIAHAALCALKWRWLPVYCLAAACEATIYSGLTGFSNFDTAAAQMMAQCIVSSIACAAIAWFVRRPDKDTKPDKTPVNVF